MRGIVQHYYVYGYGYGYVYFMNTDLGCSSPKCSDAPLALLVTHHGLLDFGQTSS